MHQQEVITLFQWMLYWLLAFVVITAYDEGSHMSPSIMMKRGINKYGILILLVVLAIFLLGILK